MEKVAPRAIWTFSKSSGTTFTIGSGTAIKLKKGKQRKNTRQVVPSHLLAPMAPTLPDKSQPNISQLIRSIVIKRDKNQENHKSEVT